MTARIYVAAASREHARATTAADAVRECGGFVCSTWLQTAPEKWAGKDDRYDVDVQRQCAESDLADLRSADVLWLLWPTQPTVGAYVELGYALAHGTRVVVSGAGCHSSIFTAPCFRDLSDDVGLCEVMRLAHEISGQRFDPRLLERQAQRTRLGPEDC